MRPAKALLILGLVAVAQLVAGDTEIAEAEDVPAAPTLVLLAGSSDGTDGTTMTRVDEPYDRSDMLGRRFGPFDQEIERPMPYDVVVEFVQDRIKVLDAIFSIRCPRMRQAALEALFGADEDGDLAEGGANAGEWETHVASEEVWASEENRPVPVDGFPFVPFHSVRNWDSEETDVPIEKTEPGFHPDEFDRHGDKDDSWGTWFRRWIPHGPPHFPHPHPCPGRPWPHHFHHEHHHEGHHGPFWPHHFHHEHHHEGHHGPFWPHFHHDHHSEEHHHEHHMLGGDPVAWGPHRPMERPAWLPRSVDPLAPRPRFPPPEGDDRPVNWSIWNEDGSVNVGVIMFAALAGACAAMWTALMVQCARMCRRSAKCPMGYESVAGDEQFVIAGGKPMENPKDVDQPSK